MASSDGLFQALAGESSHFTDEDLDGEGGPLRVERLKGGEITSSDVEKLQLSGFQTVESVAYAPSVQLESVPGISASKAAQILEKATDMVPMGFMDCAEVYRKITDIIKLTTGSAKLDELLDGGISTGSVTEIFGTCGAGKSQICYTMSVTCQLPLHLRGGEGRCLFIDTGSGFSPQRIVAAAERFGLSHIDVLRNVGYARAYNSDHLLKLLGEAAAFMSKSRYALLIVDGASFLYKSDYPEESQSGIREAKYAVFMNTILKLTDQFGIAAIVTNADVGSLEEVANSEPPTMSTSHQPKSFVVATTRLLVGKGAGGIRVCKILMSPCLPESEAEFRINSAGVADTSD